MNELYNDKLTAQELETIKKDVEEHVRDLVKDQELENEYRAHLIEKGSQLRARLLAYLPSNPKNLDDIAQEIRIARPTLDKFLRAQRPNHLRILLKIEKYLNDSEKK